jgi:hypothetical protein
MSKPMAYKKVQCPIGYWRLRFEACLSQVFKDVISAQRHMLAQENFEHLPAHGR